LKLSQVNYYCNELSACWCHIISRDVSHSVQAISNDRKISHVILIQNDQIDQKIEKFTSLEKHWTLLQVLTRIQAEDVKISEDDICHHKQCSHCWAHQCNQDNDQQAKAANDSSHESKHICDSFIIWSCSSSDRVTSSSWSSDTSHKRDNHQVSEHDIWRSCLINHLISEENQQKKNQKIFKKMLIIRKLLSRNVVIIINMKKMKKQLKQNSN